MNPLHCNPRRMKIRQFPCSPLGPVSLDYLVYLSTISCGNKYLLSVNDHFSKLTQLYPVKNRIAPNASRCLIDFCFHLFRIPYKLLSDSDPSYRPKLFSC